MSRKIPGLCEARATTTHCVGVEMGEETLDRVHRDLKIIAALREGDKVYVADGNICVLHPSAYNFAWRWFRGDNRIKSMAMVHSTIMDALAIAEHSLERIMHRTHHSPSSPTSYVKEAVAHTLDCTVRRLYRELQSAVVGLKYLRITYTGDQSTTAKIDVLREGVVERLDRVAAWVNATTTTTTDTPSFNPESRWGLLSIESYAGCILLSEEDLRC